MSGWTYSRGHWTPPCDHGEPDSDRERLALDRVKKWGLQSRWKKYPQLGPIPEKWMDVGPPPASPLLYASECMKAFYLGPVRRQLNQPSILWRYLKR